ncbi:methyltransferase domain-containing protein [Arthrobacter sp. JZ12]|uniref:class I SAM-dependent methyltransferase n=1 Tax=Arthrobacter sp. JZ12 TaxID=2654190 RepID=UPI002B469827|nr:methyltransferase domain-containing protein [Arthrobacter sp. JZ12]WRH24147.1 methyltransferase domain-containing protein [Arthrobacter sp. JZ12]
MHTHNHHHDGPRVFDESFWNARYSEKQRIWSGRPNPQLVAEAEALAPGTALDVGCGEGADALWLAARGWRVTGVDISTVALARAAEHEAELSATNNAAAPTVSWEHRDLTRDEPPAGFFDLVTAQYLHLPTDQREPLFRALARAVAPGGTLLIVGHDPSDLNGEAPRPQLPDLYFTPEDIAALLDDESPGSWEHQVRQTRPREASGPDGATLAVADAVYRGRRLS